MYNAPCGARFLCLPLRRQFKYLILFNNLMFAEPLIRHKYFTAPSPRGKTGPQYCGGAQHHHCSGLDRAPRAAQQPTPGPGGSTPILILHSCCCGRWMRTSPASSTRDRINCGGGSCRSSPHSQNAISVHHRMTPAARRVISRTVNSGCAAAVCTRPPTTARAGWMSASRGVLIIMWHRPRSAWNR